MKSNVCPNCGLVATTGAKFCMACGSAIEQGAVVPSQVPVTPTPAPAINNVIEPGAYGSLLIRRKECFQGWALPLHVIIDGCQYDFNNGQELKLQLTPGVHHVLWKFWCRSDQETYVTVQAGGYYFVELVYDWVWGGFKMNPESKVS